MFRLALKMLLGDRAKYVMLVSGLTFASLLITQQAGVFLGLLTWTTATLRNVRAPIWVVDTKVQQVNETKPMRDTDISRVRSVAGVEWAVPLYGGILQARLDDGNFKQIYLMGLDSATLIGGPSKLYEGRIEDLRQDKAVIVDELAIKRLSPDPKNPLRIGSVFEINDQEARVVGICHADRSFFGYPYIYTTYEHALQYAPATRKMLSYVLVSPAPGENHTEIARRIETRTGLKAYTEEEFNKATVTWFFVNTGIPISFGTVIILGFIVGIAICTQTFYSFVHENLRNLGALKAMGASNWLLCRMLVLQAFTVGFIGYGLGLGLAASFGFSVLKNGEPPFYMPWQLPLVTLAAISLISLAACLIGIHKISVLEPAIVFRG